MPKFTCPKCKFVNRVPPEAAGPGQIIRCPGCGHSVRTKSQAAQSPDEAVFNLKRPPELDSLPISVAEHLPAVIPPAQPPQELIEFVEPTRIPPVEDRFPCPFCGERIPVEARLCRFCNQTLDPILREAQQANQALHEALVARSAPVTQTVHVTQPKTKNGCPHFLHFILTVLTCGAWLPFWILHAMVSD